MVFQVQFVTFGEVHELVTLATSDFALLGINIPRLLHIYSSDFIINATTLMHKSTLSTNNFGKNHFGQKYQKQNVLRIFRDYNGVCLKNFQRIEQKLENAFLAKFSILLRIS